jgi:hypothetical protein
VDAETVTYVFLEAEGVRVSAALPRACLLLPALPLRMRIAPHLLPARLVLPGGAEIPVGEEGEVTLSLPRDEQGVLRRADLPLSLVTSRSEMGFLIGIDDDGTPAAISGYVDAGSNLGTAPGGT